MPSIVAFGIGLALASAFAYLLFKWRIANVQSRANEKQSLLEQSLAHARELLEEKRSLSSSLEEDVKSLREALDDTKQKLAATEATRAAEEKSAEDRIAALKQADLLWKESFGSLAKDALESNAKHLRDRANEDLDKRQLAIDTLLTPISESLAKLATHSHELEVSREGAYQEILSAVQNIRQNHLDLRTETQQLVQALRSPNVRGNWGEQQLKRCIEFAGMVQYASFDLQTFVKDDSGGYRPDAEIHLPNSRTIIVDSKTPLNDFWEACKDAITESEKNKVLANHALSVREHLKQLSSKAYWRQFHRSPDFVICFLPSEALFSAALEADPALINFSSEQSVLLATPTTLIAMLKAVHFGWQQAHIAENAKNIQLEALKIYDKLRGMQDDFKDLGSRLTKASEAYNNMVAKAEGKGGIFPIARKLRNYHFGTQDIPETNFEVTPLRQLVADDWDDPISIAAGQESLFLVEGAAENEPSEN